MSLITTAAFAQNVVTGSVKDAATGDPLMGVGVIVSTGGGTVTDANGTYSVNAESNATITFNLLGYADVVEAVNGRGKIDVFMKEDINFLDEVVVMGYTTQKKNEISSSVVSLDSEELLTPSTPDLDNMIQGKAAGGVIVVTTKSAKGRNRTEVNFKASQSWGEDIVADVQLVWNITDWLTFTSAKNMGHLYQGSGSGIPPNDR